MTSCRSRRMRYDDGMSQIRVNWPVIQTLKGIGFTEFEPFEERRHIYSCRHPEGKKGKYILSKSGTLDDRHRFGDSLQSLNSVTGVVFWGRGESKIFVVPAK